MENQITERERALNAALAHAVDHSRGRGKPAADIVADAQKFYEFLTTK